MTKTIIIGQYIIGYVVKNLLGGLHLLILGLQWMVTNTLTHDPSTTPHIWPTPAGPSIASHIWPTPAGPSTNPQIWPTLAGPSIASHIWLTRHYRPPAATSGLPSSGHEQKIKRNL